MVLCRMHKLLWLHFYTQKHNTIFSMLCDVSKGVVSIRRKYIFYLQKELFLPIETTLSVDRNKAKE